MIVHPYSQKDIACLWYSTLNIIIKELKDKGIIKFDRKIITLL